MCVCVFICACVSSCAPHACGCIERPVNVRSAGTGVTGIVICSIWILGSEPGSSGRAVSTLEPESPLQSLSLVI